MLLRRVLFLSQLRAEQMAPPEASAIISITDPSGPPARLQPGWSAVLRVSFVDSDPFMFPDEGEQPGSITAEDVAAIAAFAAEQARRCRRLVVHCRHGVSRSSAVARSVCQAALLPFPIAYDKYNRFVFLVLRGAIQFAFEEARAGEHRAAVIGKPKGS